MEAPLDDRRSYLGSHECQGSKMESQMNTPAQLFEAYRQTSFLAETPTGTVCIRIGHVEAALEDLLEREGAKCWAYVTAWNPGSTSLSDEENRVRESELENEVRQAGYAFCTGQGVGADGSWKPEPSLLILGVQENEAKELGRKYGQLAIVTGCKGSPAKLMPC
jgi:hypothetical protein